MDPTLYRLAGLDRDRGLRLELGAPLVAPPAAPLKDKRDARSDAAPKD